MILDILLVQYINYASFEKMRIFGIPKTEEHDLQSYNGRYFT
jgi:hypothetical protein